MMFNPLAALQQGNQIVTQGLPPYYDTTQVNDQNNRQVANVGGKTSDQLRYEEAMRQGRAGVDQKLAQDQMNFTAGLGNAAANANTSRGMAVNAQQALNNVYQQAGDRLNTSAANTMSAINNAGQIAAGMFR